MGKMENGKMERWKNGGDGKMEGWKDGRIVKFVLIVFYGRRIKVFYS